MKKKPQAVRRSKAQPAFELLVQKMNALIDHAAKNMTDEEFMEATRKNEEINARVRARASRRDRA
jgi:hypothetical protein